MRKTFFLLSILLFSGVNLFAQNDSEPIYVCISGSVYEHIQLAGTQGTGPIVYYKSSKIPQWIRLNVVSFSQDIKVSFPNAPYTHYKISIPNNGYNEAPEKIYVTDPYGKVQTFLNNNIKYPFWITIQNDSGGSVYFSYDNQNWMDLVTFNGHQKSRVNFLSSTIYVKYNSGRGWVSIQLNSDTDYTLRPNDEGVWGFYY